MDIASRVLASCAQFALGDDGYELEKLDLNGLVQRLVLFDTYVIDSGRIQEIPELIRLLGADAVDSLLSSGCVKLYANPCAITQTGQLAPFREQKGKSLLPPGSYSFGIVAPRDRKGYLSDCLNSITDVGGVNNRKLIRLKQKAASCLVPLPDLPGRDALLKLQEDLEQNAPIVKYAVAKVASETLRADVGREQFELRMHRLDETDYRAETNLGKVLKLHQQQEVELLEKGLLRAAGLNHRVEDMKTSKALCDLPVADIGILGQKLGFLAEALVPKHQQRRMHRVLEIKGFPDFVAEGHAPDIDKLLKVRSSPECVEFRHWLRSTDVWTDAEIKQQLAGLRARLGDLVHGHAGKNVRFLLGAVVGSISLVAGPLVSAIDRFLVERILPRSGVVAFVNRMYPSIFRRKAPRKWIEQRPE